MSDPVKDWYNKGYEMGKAGKKQRNTAPQNFKLAYVNGYFDGRLGRPHLYNERLKGK
jgi:hypothetical protein